MTGNPTYQKLSGNVYEAEGMLINRELIEEPTNTAVLTHISKHDKDQESILSNHTAKLERIKRQIENLSMSDNPQVEASVSIAAVNRYSPMQSLYPMYGFMPQQSGVSA